MISPAFSSEGSIRFATLGKSPPATRSCGRWWTLEDLRRGVLIALSLPCCVIGCNRRDIHTCADFVERLSRDAVRLPIMDMRQHHRFECALLHPSPDGGVINTQYFRNLVFR